MDFEAAEKCRLYVTTIRALNFQDGIPSIPSDNFKDHHVLVFDLTSMQYATESCHYPEILGGPLRLELNYTFALEHVNGVIVLGERKSSVAVDRFGVVGKISQMDNVSLQQLFNQIPLLKYRYLGFFPSDYVPILPTQTFAFIKTQPSKMHGEHWMATANSRHKLYLGDSTSQPSIHKQHYEQMMPELLHFHPSVSTRYMQLFISSSSDQKITGTHDVNVLSFISNYM